MKYRNILNETASSILALKTQAFAWNDDRNIDKKGKTGCSVMMMQRLFVISTFRKSDFIENVDSWISGCREPSQPEMTFSFRLFRWDIFYIMEKIISRSISNRFIGYIKKRLTATPWVAVIFTIKPWKYS